MERVKVVLPPVVADRFADEETGYEVVTWDGASPVPAEARDAVVWVPSYAGGFDGKAVRRAFEELPSLQVVQLLSAGVDGWRELLPEGVTLCNGRSIHG